MRWIVRQRISYSMFQVRKKYEKRDISADGLSLFSGRMS
jgi:hypothetical protein